MSEEDQLKCRLWDKHEHKMIYPEDAKNGKEVIAIGLHGLPIVVDQDSFRDGQVVGWNVDHRYIPMQFTGYKDKNGKNIYKDDIVRVNEGQGVLEFMSQVIFAQAAFRIAAAYSQGFPDAQDIEIIGNVHERPDLAREVAQS